MNRSDLVKIQNYVKVQIASLDQKTQNAFSELLSIMQSIPLFAVRVKHSTMQAIYHALYKLFSYVGYEKQAEIIKSIIEVRDIKYQYALFRQWYSKQLKIFDKDYIVIPEEQKEKMGGENIKSSVSYIDVLVALILLPLKFVKDIVIDTQEYLKKSE